MLPFNFEVFERDAACAVNSALAGLVLPAADNYVAIQRVDLYDTSFSSSIFASNAERPAARKGIEDECAAVRAILDRVGHHGDRFSRRVQGKIVHSIRAK